MENAGADAEQSGIVIAAIAMAHSLKLQVVTEGVETKQQQSFLEEQGCEMAQGFLYAKPCPATEFLEWLHRSGKASVTSIA